MGRSRAKAPTRAQKVMIANAGLHVRNWLVIADTETELRLVHKGTGKSRIIKKSAGAGTPSGKK